MTILKTKALQLTIHVPEKVSLTYPIYLWGLFTPFGTCVDHGTYYEIANRGFYVKIDKNTMKVTSNRVTPHQFEPDSKYAAEIVAI
ncbi:MAG: hypothetical protein FWD84_02850 [Oscillospiraceae bacterium]|nr:hypothetical protein [Oscillospiraceae bacterium]